MEEEEEDEEEVMKRKEAERECAKASQQQEKKEASGGDEGKDKSDKEGGKEGGDGEEAEDLSSVEGLMNKLRSLHLVMRIRQLDALRKANNEVRAYETAIQVFTERFRRCSICRQRSGVKQRRTIYPVWIRGLHRSMAPQRWKATRQSGRACLLPLQIS